MDSRGRWKRCRGGGGSGDDGAVWSTEIEDLLKRLEQRRGDDHRRRSVAVLAVLLALTEAVKKGPSGLWRQPWRHVTTGMCLSPATFGQPKSAVLWMRYPDAATRM